MAQTELDVLRDVSQRLGGAGMAFMLTGSVAMNYYAQPRMTRDIDLVVALTPADTDTFVRLFETDYFVDRETVALRSPQIRFQSDPSRQCDQGGLHRPQGRGVQAGGVRPPAEDCPSGFSYLDRQP